MSILIPDLASGVDSPPPFFEGPSSLAKVLRALEIRNTSSDALAESLPFSSSDATAGTENELQAVVLGGIKRMWTFPSPSKSPITTKTF